MIIVFHSGLNGAPFQANQWKLWLMTWYIYQDDTVSLQSSSGHTPRGPLSLNTLRHQMFFFKFLPIVMYGCSVAGDCALAVTPKETAGLCFCLSIGSVVRWSITYFNWLHGLEEAAKIALCQRRKLHWARGIEPVAFLSGLAEGWTTKWPVAGRQSNVDLKRPCGTFYRNFNRQE